MRRPYTVSPGGPVRDARGHTPRPGTVLTNALARSASNAPMTVPTAMPCFWLSVLAEGSMPTAGYFRTCADVIDALYADTDEG